MDKLPSAIHPLSVGTIISHPTASLTARWPDQFATSPLLMETNLPNHRAGCRIPVDPAVAPSARAPASSSATAGCSAAYPASSRSHFEASLGPWGTFVRGVCGARNSPAKSGA
ncbi:hypothetical protein ACJZ2D_002615 [Fusarium nematophilum]